MTDKPLQGKKTLSHCSCRLDSLFFFLSCSTIAEMMSRKDTVKNMSVMICKLIVHMLYKATWREFQKVWTKVMRFWMSCVIILFFIYYDFSHCFKVEAKESTHFLQHGSKDAVQRCKCYLPLVQAAGNPGRVSCKQEG